MTSYYECAPPAAWPPDLCKAPPPELAQSREIRARRPALFLRLSAGQEGFEWMTGQFGLVPGWVKSASDARLRSAKLVQARCETVSSSRNFQDSWLRAQRCIVPMMAFFEDDWRSGRAVPTRIARVDGLPLGVAGLWEQWEREGSRIVSFTVLTVNADRHALMHRYQPPGSEKRMPLILNEGAYGAWLRAPLEKAHEFMRAFPAQSLTANPVQGR